MLSTLLSREKAPRVETLARRFLVDIHGFYGCDAGVRIEGPTSWYSDAFFFSVWTLVRPWTRVSRTHTSNNLCPRWLSIIHFVRGAQISAHSTRPPLLVWSELLFFPLSRPEYDILPESSPRSMLVWILPALPGDNDDCRPSVWPKVW
jgi:hypothetical protein